MPTFERVLFGVHVKQRRKDPSRTISNLNTEIKSENFFVLSAKQAKEKN